MQMVKDTIERLADRIGQLAVVLAVGIEPDFLRHGTTLLGVGVVPLPISRAGMPTTVAPAGTAFTTTEFEPTRALSPIVIGPSIFAPAPTTTFLPSVGCRMAFSQLVPPSVTP